MNVIKKEEGKHVKKKKKGKERIQKRGEKKVKHLFTAIVKARSILLP